MVKDVKTILIDKRVHKRLKAVCAMREYTMHVVVSRLIEEWLNNDARQSSGAVSKNR